MKLEIPKFRYLSQGEDGSVHSHVTKPRKYKGQLSIFWACESFDIKLIAEDGLFDKKRCTLIDLEVDDYEFEDGILRRVEK